MRTLKIGLACVAVLVAFSSPVSAGKIFLSGDVNINDLGALGGSNDNDIFFSNVLGSGTNVLIHDEFSYNGGTLNSYFNGLGGVTSTLFSGDSTITGVSLAGIDLFFSILPASSYGAGEISALSSFLSGGGTVFFQGDNGTFFSTENARINAALSALGSLMSITNADIDLGYTLTSNIDADPFTSGVSTFVYGATSSITTGGTSLIRTASTGGVTFVAYENTIVPEPGSIIAMLSLVSFGAGAVVIRRRRAKKLAA